MISVLGSEAVAGIGIIRKIDQLAYAVNQGITQGMLPLVAYCYASGRWSRMWRAVGFSALCSEIFSLCSTTISILFAPQLISIFIQDDLTIQYGAQFLKVLCLAIPLYTLTFVVIAFFQAVGHGVEPFILSVLHKGPLEILFLYLLLHFSGTSTIIWASPFSETVALVVAGIMLFHFLRKHNEKSPSVSH